MPGDTGPEGAPVRPASAAGAWGGRGADCGTGAPGVPECPPGPDDPPGRGPEGGVTGRPPAVVLPGRLLDEIIRDAPPGADGPEAALSIGGRGPGTVPGPRSSDFGGVGAVVPAPALASAAMSDAAGVGAATTGAAGATGAVTGAIAGSDARTASTTGADGVGSTDGRGGAGVGSTAFGAAGVSMGATGVSATGSVAGSVDAFAAAFFVTFGGSSG